MLILSIAAVGCYLFAAFRTATALSRLSLAEGNIKLQILMIGLIAICLHGVILFQDVVTSFGLNLSIFSAASLIAWMMALLLLVATLYKPLENLVVVLLPLAAIALGLERIFPGHRILALDAPLGLRFHVVLSIVAYSLLTIAALQAIMLAIADKRLHDKRPSIIIDLLPPLQTMEELMFQLIGLGFFILTLGLVSGFMFVEDLLAQHLAHKTILSVGAWLVFAILLWGRRTHGWRGRVAVRYTLSGFIVLMLAFFGSKFVLELILNRV